MVLKVATTSLHWSHPSVPQSPSTAQALAPAISSKRRNSVDGAMFCHRPSLFGSHQSSIYRSRSCENLGSRSLILRRALSDSLASFSDEEFSKKIQELAVRFRHSDDDDKEQTSTSDSRITGPRHENGDEHDENFKPFDAVMEHPSFLKRYEIIPANIERRASNVDIPFSLGIIRRKKQLQDGFKEVGGSAYSSMKKAFSSMVFIIQELSSYSLQMRENLFCEDLQGILTRVQGEMNASFVWLFQQVFSHTPTLMVYVMILLANYSVYSMSIYPAIAAMSPVQQTYTEEVSVSEDQGSTNRKFDSSIIRTLNLSSSDGKTTSIGGNNGGDGGKNIPIASGEDGDGRFEESNFNRTVVPERISSIESSVTNGGELVSNQDKEVVLWDSFVEEVSRDEGLDQETMQGFISPVDAKIETDDQAEHFKMELQYQTSLAQEPNNSLLLANYAQFLYLVTHDLDRAEEYFKRAVAVVPKDAEACNKYASFMWKVRNDLWVAEEIYQEAIEAEPENSYYAANYAHFLWNTGGEDTCFVSPDSSSDV